MHYSLGRLLLWVSSRGSTVAAILLQLTSMSYDIAYDIVRSCMRTNRCMIFARSWWVARISILIQQECVFSVAIYLVVGMTIFCGSRSIGSRPGSRQGGVSPCKQAQPVK